MITDKQQKNLQFLRDMPDIFIPSRFTYWCHNTMYKPECDWVGHNDKRNWTEIPTDFFVIKKDMSFVTKVQRLQASVDYGKSPSTSYANTKNSLPFQIRVVQPRRTALKSFVEDGLFSQDEFKTRMWNNNGLGDYRHPKLPRKTKIYIIGSATKDEVSGEKIDIVYGVAEEDIDILVAELMKEYKTDCQEDANYCVESGTVFEFDKPTIILKNQDETRLKDTLTQLAGYKKDYEDQKTHSLA